VHRLSDRVADVARGSVFRKDGGWGFRVDAGLHSASGKRRQILRQGFATKRAAEVALAELAGEANRGLVVSRSSMTVGEYLVEWFESARPSLRPTTSRGYEQSIVRLTTNLGRVRLQALTPMQVQRCYTDLLESGGRDGKPLAPKTVRHAHVVLRKALGDAERMGLVSRNAAAAARPPSGEHTEMTTWSSEDLRDFLAAAEGHPYEIGFRLLAATGLRRGEVLGLRWRDVDFDLGQIAVAHTITEIGAEVVMGPPKTARSRRNVYLDRRTLAALREHRQRQRAQRLAAGPAWDVDHDWVLTDELGGFVRPQSMSYSWRVLMEQIDVPTIRLHDLRHTHATLALKAGVHPKVVSERLGHATVGITLDLYSHVVPSLARDAAEQIMSTTYGDDT
jgi:integrase